MICTIDPCEKETRNNDPFTSKVAVITGGSRGIGFNTAKALVDRGVKVVIGDILDKEGNEAVKELNEKAGKQVAAFIHTDVTKYNDLLSLFELADKSFGSVDIAILNAGITGVSGGGVFTPLDDDGDMFLHEVNMGGVIKGDKVALLYMGKKQDQGGVIINIASMAVPVLSSYTASKHAVVGWTRSLANMKAICNVRVNAVKKPQNLEATPSTKMEYIVQAMLKCMEDTSLSGDLVLALPDGIYVQPNYVPPGDDHIHINDEKSSISPEFIEKYPKIQQGAINWGKKKLKEAIQLADL
ncbi:hypothetical protein BDA99DRAFT_532786 [Phascolomyces articulosus]|uniref:Uncharacterized protein n=1 Tax=Phascolomyces articulosus TaxID=60185 RepID=A0AAD5K9Z9_9FUNG|nr:hypothetical protein BDA99DRAFT_532786 [Phascolomyces articulosus]